MKKFTKFREGFTVLEVVVVLVIIAIITAAAIPGFSNMVSQAKVTKAINDMRTVQTAVVQYLIYNSDTSDISLDKLYDGGFIGSKPSDISVSSALSDSEIHIIYTKADPKHDKFIIVDPNIEKDSDEKPMLRIIKN